ncbi:tenascin-X-like [Glandiceps talaboti]
MARKWRRCDRNGEVLVLLVTIMVFLNGISGQNIQSPGVFVAESHFTYPTTSRLYYIQGDASSIFEAAARKEEQHPTILSTGSTSLLVGLSLDLEDNLLFWADQLDQGVYRYSLRNNAIVRIHYDDTTELRDLTVDWISKTLYWADSDNKWIIICDYFGRNPTPVITNTDVLSVTVEPLTGYLYWSVSGSSPTKMIEMSTLNGENRKVISSTDSVELICLTIDYSENRLFWVDTQLDGVVIRSSTLEGNDIRVFFYSNTITSSRDMWLTQDFVFVCDSTQNQLQILGRSDPSSSSSSIKLGSDMPTSVAYFADNAHSGPSPPLDFVVLDFTTTTISVTWRYPASDISFYVLYYTGPNGHLITAATISSSMAQYQFTGLTPATLYTLTIRSKVIIDNSARYSDTTFLSQMTKPNAPLSFAVSYYSTRSITVTWQPPVGRFSYYVLSYSGPGGQMMPVGPVASGRTDYQITGLLPSTVYTVSIKSVSMFESTGLYSEERTLSQTTRALLEGDVMITGVTTSSISIVWGAARDARYLITIRPADGNGGALLQEDTTQYTFVNLVAGRLYTISVTYVGSNRLNEVKARTEPLAPVNFVVSHYTATAITVTWRAPRGEVSFYALSFVDSSGYLTKTLTLPSSSTEYQLTGLQAATQYTLTIMSVAVNGDIDIYSTERSLTQSTAVRTAGHITVTDVTTTSIKIALTASMDDSVTGYRLNISPTSGNNVVFLQPDTLTHTFRNLIAGRKYNINVEMRGPNTMDSVVVATKPNDPVNFVVSYYTTTTMTVAWLAPQGDVSAYVLSYTNPYGQMTSSGAIASSRSEYLFTGLQPATEYKLSIRSMSFNGNTYMYSNEMAISQTTPVVKTGGIIVTDITTSRISIRWAASTDDTVNGYLLTITPTAGNDVIFLPKEAIRHTFDNLVPGRMYVISIKLTGTNTIEKVTVRTRPSIPAQFAVTHSSPTTLTVTWGAREGDVSFYEFSYVTLDGTLIKTATIPGSRTDYQFTGLQPATEYTLNIRSMVVFQNNELYSDKMSTSYATPVVRTGGIIVTDVSTSSISIQWEDSDAATRYRLTLTSPDRSDVLYVPKDNNRYTFTNLMAGREYNIEVQYSGPNTIEQVTVSTKPNAPMTLHVSEYSPTTLTVTWDESDGKVDFYEFSYIDSNGKKVTAGTIPSSVKEYQFTGLQPASWFTFAARSKVISGNIVLYSKERMQPFSTPIMNSGGIEVTDVTTSSVSITWGPTIDDSVTGYHLSIAPSDRNGIVNVHRDAVQHTFKDLVPGREYTIMVQKVGPDTVEEVTVKTEPIPPASLALTHQTPSTLTVSWQAPEGEVDSYKLSYNDPTGKETVAGIIPSTVREYKFTGMQPATDYTLALQSMVGSSTTDIYSKERIMFQKTPVFKVDDVTVTDVTTSTISIGWRARIDDSVSGYLVSITPDYGNKVAYLPKEGVQHTFNNLAAGRQYQIEFKVAGPNTVEEITVRTKPNVPVNFIVSHYTPSTVTVTWQAPKHEVTFYDLSYKSPDAETTKSATIPSSETSYQFTGLRPATEYTFILRSKVHSGDTDIYSKERIISQTTPFVSVNDIDITDVTTSSVSVVWPPSTEDSVSGYRLSITPSDGNDITNLAKDISQHTFYDLVAGREYVISLTLLGPNTGKKATTRTKPNAPIDFTVSGRTPSTLTTSWQEPEGEVDMYELSYTNPVDQHTTVATIPSSRHEYQFTGLPTGTESTLLIRSLVFSDDIDLYSDERVISQKTDLDMPGDIVVKDVTTSSISIQWDESTNRRVTGYALSITPTDGTPTNENTAVSVPKDTVHYTFNGLVAGKEYDITLRREGTTTVEKVTAKTKPNPPVDVAVSSYAPTSLTLKWEAPEGEVSFYVLSHIDALDKMTTVGKIPSSRQEYKFTNLQPVTEHRLAIRSMVVSGDMDLYSTRKVISPTTPVTKVDEIVITGVTTSSISLLWALSRDDSIMGYRLTITPANGNSPTTLPSDVNWHTFNDLIAGKKYELSVEKLHAGPETIADEISARTKPHAPIDFTVSDYTSTTITVTWVTPEAELGTYELSYTDPDDKVTTVRPVPNSGTEYQFTGLKPATVYILAIKSKVLSGDTDVYSKERTVTQNTLVTEADGIVVTDVTTSSISTQWTKSGDVRITGYLVSITPAEGNAVVSLPKDVYHHTFNNLVSGREYVIAVRKEGPDTVDDVTTRTKPKAPVNFIVNGYTRTTFTVTWKAAKGEVSFYVLSYIDPEGTLTTVDTVPSSRTKYKFVDLEPTTKYILLIRSMVISGKTNLYSKKRLTIDKTPVTTQGGLIIPYVTPSRISILHGADLDDDISGYTLSISPTDGNNVITLPKYQIYHTFETLVAGREYVITVQREGTNTGEDITIKTKPIEPHNFIVTDYAVTTIDVKWDRPAGIVDSYMLSFIDPEGVHTMAGTVPSRRTTYHFTGLQPITEYTLSVRSVVVLGDTHLYSKERITSQITLVESAADLAVTDVTTSSVSLEWGTSTDDIVTGYRLTISPAEEHDAVNLPKATTQHSFYNLVSGRVYTIVVLFVGPDVQEEVAVRIKPNAPLDFIVSDYEPSSVTVTWRAPRGEVDFYVLSYRPADGKVKTAATLPNNQTEYEYTGLDIATPYILIIRSMVVFRGSNIYSNDRQRSQTTQPTSPGIILIDGQEVTSLNISWVAASGYFDDYEISVKPPKAAAYVAGIVSRSEIRIYTIPDLDPDTTYQISIVTRVGPSYLYIRSAPSTTTGTTLILPIVGGGEVPGPGLPLGVGGKFGTTTPSYNVTDNSTGIILAAAGGAGFNLWYILIIVGLILLLLLCCCCCICCFCCWKRRRKRRREKVEHPYVVYELAKHTEHNYSENTEPHELSELTIRSEESDLATKSTAIAQYAGNTGFMGISGHTGQNAVANQSTYMRLAESTDISGSSNHSGQNGYLAHGDYTGHSGFSANTSHSLHTDQSGLTDNSGSDEHIYVNHNGNVQYSKQSGFAEHSALTSHAGGGGGGGGGGMTGFSGQGGLLIQSGFTGTGERTGHSKYSGNSGLVVESGQSGFTTHTERGGHTGHSEHFTGDAGLTVHTGKTSHTEHAGHSGYVENDGYIMKAEQTGLTGNALYKGQDYGDRSGRYPEQIHYNAGFTAHSGQTEHVEHTRQAQYTGQNKLTRSTEYIVNAGKAGSSGVGYTGHTWHPGRDQYTRQIDYPGYPDHTSQVMYGEQNGQVGNNDNVQYTVRTQRIEFSGNGGSGDTREINSQQVGLSRNTEYTGSSSARGTGYSGHTWHPGRDQHIRHTEHTVNADHNVQNEHAENNGQSLLDNLMIKLGMHYNGIGETTGDSNRTELSTSTMPRQYSKKTEHTTYTTPRGQVRYNENNTYGTPRELDTYVAGSGNGEHSQHTTHLVTGGQTVQTSYTVPRGHNTYAASSGNIEHGNHTAHVATTGQTEQTPYVVPRGYNTYAASSGNIEHGDHTAHVATSGQTEQTPYVVPRGYNTYAASSGNIEHGDHTAHVATSGQTKHTYTAPRGHATFNEPRGHTIHTEHTTYTASSGHNTYAAPKSHTKYAKHTEHSSFTAPRGHTKHTTAHATYSSSSNQTIEQQKQWNGDSDQEYWLR